MSLRLLVAGIAGLMILAFNPHIVSGIKDQIDKPIQAWKKNPDKLDSPLAIKSPKFPDREHQRPDARRTDQPRPHTATGGKHKGTSAKQRQDAQRDGFGARAVGVQRARGL